MRSFIHKYKIILVVIASLILLRLIPYLAPIHPEDIPQISLAVEYRSRDHQPLGTILSQDQNHTATVTLKEISPYFIQAIIAAEDGGFYHHGPLDLKAIARAGIQAVKHRKILSGASTITMQLARMLEPNPRNLGAKIQEVWLSWRLAAGMTKDEILQAYINRLPMGSNIYGVEAASRIYFNTPAAQLTIAQASLLAGIPNNPNYLSPYTHFQGLKTRQQYVLKRMVAEKYLSQNQQELAYKETVQIQPRQQGIIAAPHFLFWLTKQLPPQHPSVIATTIDLELQNFAQAQVKEILRALKPHNVEQAAVLVINNHTGEILAYVGSQDYFAELGNNDGVQALRQPGSTLKPFLYEMGLETGVIKPNSILADIPTTYAIPGAQNYTPKDYTNTFYGPVTVRTALANSLNIPAVRLLEKVGVANFLERLHQLGFVDLSQSAEHYGLGLALGSGEVSLWQLAQAYLIMSQEGNIKPLTTFLNYSLVPPLLRGGRGGSKPEFSPVPTHWQIVTDILSDPYARAKAFGVDSVLNLPFPVAVKTGTSSNFRDTWTVGFTTDYTVATWVGNFNGIPMQQVSGVTGAAPLWARIMLHLYQNKEPAPFPPPADMVKRPICAISGLKPTPACTSVVEEYFSLQDLEEYQSDVDSFYQTTPEGSALSLPRQYDEWLAKQPQVNLSQYTVKIISPNKGDRFLLTPGEAATLEFKLATQPKEKVEWRLNGVKIATNKAKSLFWQIRPGTWTLEVKSHQNIDDVTFQVNFAPQTSPKRGFTIAN